MVVTSNERAISTVRSVDPSLTTMISSINPLFVSAISTSASVFSSLYAALMAEAPNDVSLMSSAGVQRADHTTALCHFRRCNTAGQTVAQGDACHETQPHFR